LIVTIDKYPFRSPAYLGFVKPVKKKNDYA
jgi:hypothetical protein